MTAVSMMSGRAAGMMIRIAWVDAITLQRDNIQQAYPTAKSGDLIMADGCRICSNAMPGIASSSLPLTLIGANKGKPHALEGWSTVARCRNAHPDNREREFIAFAWLLL